MLDMALISACSPNVAPTVANAIVKTESRFNPYAIGVNRGTRLTKQPTSQAEAVSIAKALLKNGANIDLGLAQINSANLAWLNLSVEQAFEPCANLNAMQTVYLDCLKRAGNNGLGTAMQRAFSCYNTGSLERGFRNGYVNKATKNFNYFLGKSNQINYQQYPYQQKPVQVQAINVEKTEENQAEEAINQDVPVKVFHAWDVYKEF